MIVIGSAQCGKRYFAIICVLWQLLKDALLADSGALLATGSIRQHKLKLNGRAGQPAET